MMRGAVALMILAGLAGCHRAAPQRPTLDALDDQLTTNVVTMNDPAIATALHADRRPAPIVAAPSRAVVAPTPATSATPGPHDAIARCAGSLTYAADWARRLPRGVTLYPGAAIDEVAGSDADGCALRVVSFTTPAPARAVAAWYRAHPGGLIVADRTAAGRHTLTGDAPDRAFILYLDPAGGGTSGDLIADGGR